MRRLISLLNRLSTASLDLFRGLWMHAFRMIGRVSLVSSLPLLQLLLPWMRVGSSATAELYPRGIKNLGNTCYVNALLQVFANTSTLVEYTALHVKNRRHRNNFLMQLNFALRDLAPKPRHWYSFSWSFNPILILRSLRAFDERYVGIEQHDTHEFLDTIMRALGDSESSRVAIPPNPMEGRSLSFLNCRKCDWSRAHNQETPFYYLSLSIPASATHRPHLVDCMKAHLKAEELHVDCIRCTLIEEIRRLEQMIEAIGKNSSIVCLGAEKSELEMKISMIEDRLRSILHDTDTEGINDLELLSTLGIARMSRHIHEKYSSVTRWPEILCVHLCRLNFDVETSRPVKDSTHVAFNGTLSMGDNSPGSAPNYGYTLIAVVEHHGGAWQGHYTAYVRVTQTSGSFCWFHISDEVVTSVSIADVLKAKAYLLFYEKV